MKRKFFTGSDEDIVGEGRRTMFSGNKLMEEDMGWCLRKRNESEKLFGVN